MKIFNWVHRKFHHKDGKKAELVTNEAETQVLLEHVITLPNALDDWRYGILTIGTFGFDPLSHFNQKIDQSPYNIEYEDEEEEEEEEEECDEEDYAVHDNDQLDDQIDIKECEEEVNPLVFAAFGRGFDENAMKSDLQLAICVTTPQDLEDNDKGKKKRERTTLADLFSADSDVVKKNTKRDRGLKLKKKSINNKAADDHGDDDLVQAKKGLSFAKKLIPRAVDNTRPIKKLHQLMTRMLKRKIHPDLEGQFQKRDVEMMKPAMGGIDAEEYVTNESVSLLET